MDLIPESYLYVAIFIVFLMIALCVLMWASRYKNAAVRNGQLIEETPQTTVFQLTESSTKRKLKTVTKDKYETGENPTKEEKTKKKRGNQKQCIEVKKKMQNEKRREKPENLPPLWKFKLSDFKKKVN